MPIIQLIVILIVIGVLLWVFNTYIPMDYTIRRIINVVILVLVVLWILSVLGVLSGVGGKVGHAALAPPDPPITITG